MTMVTTSDGAIDDREARFLASQSARLRHASATSGSRSAISGHDDVEDGAAAAAADDEEEGEQAASAVRTRFWDDFRQCCAVLARELDGIESGAILANHDDGDDGRGDCGDASCRDGAICEYATASARAVASSRLDAALASLRLLERHCLSTSSSSASVYMDPVASPSSSPTTVAGDDSDVANDKGTSRSIDLQLPAAVPDHLPPGDVRLLTTELGSLRNRLDELRDDICPPELFVFRRYRAAMAAKADDAACSVGAGTCATSSSIDGGLAASTIEEPKQQEQEQREKLDLEQHYGSSIRNQTNCTITVTESEMLSYSTSEEDTAASGVDANAKAVTTSTPLDAADAGSSLLIKDVERCQIVVNRQYQSIHIINATDCTITALFVVSGPVHVTNCHGTTISTACRQLRIHDCTAVTFRVWVKSGPIIEHCSKMVFRGDPIDVRGSSCDDDGNGDNGGVCHWDEAANMYHDVKDFCWLRTGVPSPNFAVVQCSDSDPGEGGGTEEGGADEECAGCGQEVDANDDVNTDGDEDASSSDEDEL